MAVQPMEASPEQPPHDAEAERSVVGAIMRDPGALAKVADFLAAEDFYGQVPKAVYGAALRVAAQGIPIDNVTVAAELERMGMLERGVSRTHLARLQEWVPTAANVEFYARRVKAGARRRRLIAAGHEIIRQAWDMAADEDDLVASAGARIHEIALDQRRRSKLVGELLRDFPQELDRRQALGGRPPGLPSGLPDLDRMTGGWDESQLILLGGRSSMGKTAAGVHFALHAAMKHKRPVAIFSLEMSETQIMERLVGNEAQVSSQRMRSGLLGDAEHERVMRAITRLYEAPIVIDDRAGIDEWQLAAEARRLNQQFADQGGLGLVVVDYIGMLRPHAKSESRERDLGSITEGLKGLAKELRCPVLALAQFNREVEKRGGDKRPQLSDFKGSGDLEAHADVAIGAYRSAYYERDRGSGGEQEVEFHVLKQRNGPTGVVKALFMPEKGMAFGSLDRRRGGLA